MAHSHAHAGHGHAGHAHARDPGSTAGSQRRLLLVIGAILVVLVGELVAAWLSNSLALLSDAVHMSTDLAALALAYVAIRLAARPATSSKTYGYYRAETVAAFLNALLLWVVAAYLVWEAVQRLQAPPQVSGPIVLVVGALTLAANLGMALVLHRDHNETINLRSAYLHVLSDALGSLAAVVAGAGLVWFDAAWLDPAATLAIAALVVLWTWRLTRESLHILLEGTPASVKPEAVRDAIEAVPGVMAVHDLHVWSLTTGMDNLSAHVQVHDASQGPEVVRAIRDRLRHDFALSHVTIEVETSESDCVGCN